MVSCSRRGSQFRKEKGKRGKGAHENKEKKKLIAMNSPGLHCKEVRIATDFLLFSLL